MTARPLAGLRVLDLGQVYNGPYCGLLLAAQGAEVIKVEPPGGEIVRRFPISPGGASYSFLMLNADKLGVTLNLKAVRGRALFLDLVAHADVVLENFRDDGVLDGFGLGWEALAARNPRIVLARGRGYRRGSAYERFAAMDFTVQAISGQMAITGFADQPPVKAGATMCDMLGSVHLFSAILLALRERDQTGRGRAVEVAMLDATFPALMSYSSPYLETGIDPGRTGNQHSVPRSGPYGVFPTTDGWVAITCVTDTHWLAYTRAAGERDLEDDLTLRDAPGRALRRDELERRVGAWTSSRARDEIVELLTAAGVPCAPVRSLPEAIEDPYNVEQGLLRHVAYDGWGEVRVLGSPIQLRDADARRADPEPPAPPPRLGEHNRRIYGGLLGLDDARLDELEASGVI